VKTHEGSVAVSAKTGSGIGTFLDTLSDRLRAMARITELVVPYDRGDVLAAVRREGEVVSEQYEDGGVRVRARLGEASVGRLAAYVVASGVSDRAASGSS
jgi:GTP-binding protein HflX